VIHAGRIRDSAVYYIGMSSLDLSQWFRLAPFVLTSAVVVSVLILAHVIVQRRFTGEASVSRQVAMLGATVVGVLMIIFSLPISETSRGQLFRAC